MQLSADAKFNYAMLTEDKAASARAAAERIRGRMQLAAESIIEVGKELIAQKAALGHGNFLPWIEAEFGMSRDSAHRFMTIAGELGPNVEHVRHLSSRTLYALAAPSTPEPVRAEVLERAANGEKVTAKEIEALKRKLAKAEEEAAENASLAAIRDARAKEAEQQRDHAQNQALFYKSDLEHAQEEIARLREDGTIHVLTPDPVSSFNDAFVANTNVETPWTDDDAQFRVLKSVWKESSNTARARFVDWINSHHESVAA